MNTATADKLSRFQSGIVGRFKMDYLISRAAGMVVSMAWNPSQPQGMSYTCRPCQMMLNTSDDLLSPVNFTVLNPVDQFFLWDNRLPLQSAVIVPGQTMRLRYYQWQNPITAKSIQTILGYLYIQAGLTLTPYTAANTADFPIYTAWYSVYRNGGEEENGLGYSFPTASLDPNARNFEVWNPGAAFTVSGLEEMWLYSRMVGISGLTWRQLASLPAPDLIMVQSGTDKAGLNYDLERTVAISQNTVRRSLTVNSPFWGALDASEWKAQEAWQFFRTDSDISDVATISELGISSVGPWAASIPVAINRFTAKTL